MNCFKSSRTGPRAISKSEAHDESRRVKVERRPLVVERVDEAKADETGKAARRVEQYLEARRVVI